MHTVKLLKEIICASLSSSSLSEECFQAITDEERVKLFKLSKHHDVAHIVGEYLENNKLLKGEGETSKLFRQEYMTAVFRVRRIDEDVRRISDLLEEGKIPHILLKGSHIRSYYEKPWFRTSCDIDILVRKEDIESAKELIAKKLSYSYKASSDHDISLYSPSGIHLELHHTLISEQTDQKTAQVLSVVWENTVKKEGREFTFFMNNSTFYFYHIAHMAKHFLAGGCGIKAFIDLYVIKTKMNITSEERALFIEKSHLADFEKAVCKLTDYWFSESAEIDENLLLMENYILRGGSYGTFENGTSVGIVKTKGRFAYIIRRIFPPFSSMAVLYPILEKYKYLLPLFHVKRWFRVIFGSGMKRARVEFRVSATISDDERKKTEKMLNELGLI